MAACSNPPPQPTFTLPPPRTFSAAQGSEFTIHGFLSGFETWARAIAGEPRDWAKRHVALYLESPASVWFTSEIAPKLDDLTWAETKEQLNNVFRRHTNAVLNTLLAREQGENETVAQYADEIARLSHMVNIKEECKTILFVKGLRQALKIQVAPKLNSSFHEAVINAQNAESMLISTKTVWQEELTNIISQLQPKIQSSVQCYPPTSPTHPPQFMPTYNAQLNTMTNHTPEHNVHDEPWLEPPYHNAEIPPYIPEEDWGQSAWPEAPEAEEEWHDGHVSAPDWHDGHVSAPEWHDDHRSPQADPEDWQEEEDAASVPRGRGRRRTSRNRRSRRRGRSPSRPGVRTPLEDAKFYRRMLEMMLDRDANMSKMNSDQESANNGNALHNVHDDRGND